MGGSLNIEIVEDIFCLLICEPFSGFLGFSFRDGSRSEFGFGGIFFSLLASLVFMILTRLFEIFLILFPGGFGLGIEFCLGHGINKIINSR